MPFKKISAILIFATIVIIISSCNVEDEANDGQSNGNLTDYQDIIQSVSPLGGTVSLPNIGSVTFPFGTFRQSKSVTFKVTRDAGVDADFRETTILFDVVSRLSYEVQIDTNDSQPLVDTQVTLTIPEDFRRQIPLGSKIRVFAQNLWDDGNERLDTFELLEPRFEASSSSITFALAPYFFTNKRSSSNTFEAIVTLGITQKIANQLSLQSTTDDVDEVTKHIANDSPVFDEKLSLPQPLISVLDYNPSKCKGSKLSSPLSHYDYELKVTSGFGERKPPTGGASSYHTGIDFGVPSGTSVTSMANGTVELVTVQNTQKREPCGKPCGYGQYVVIKHNDGSKSLYAHLTLGSARVKVGQKVNAGDIIALSGNTGTSSGPHLHISYAPNGTIKNLYEKGGTVDPVPCIDVCLSITRANSLEETLFDLAFSAQ